MVFSHHTKLCPKVVTSNSRKIFLILRKIESNLMSSYGAGYWCVVFCCQLIYSVKENGKTSTTGKVYFIFIILQWRMPVWYLILRCQNRMSLSSGLDS